ncbi:Adhesion G-protein coupled receptor G6 [Holothuria leucospilota]|uniref:Adhesion G-protein coupled receptor G6 n=1 Tax=Holothuria leucospilota TaxID=206669 RepID=A0A9Q0YDF3_HOLLE|nr:Adhesion G-protein coupled receptor G6 [Holothuria leucospilota]
MMTTKNICPLWIAAVFFVSLPVPVLSQSRSNTCAKFCLVTPSARPILKCLRVSDICNGIIDCYDGEDERNCNDEFTQPAVTTENPNALTSPVVCGTEEFLCSEMECVPQRLVCDRFADCSNSRDEENCTSRGLLRKDLARPGTYGRYFLFAWPETYPDSSLRISMFGVSNETSAVTISIQNTLHSWTLDVPAQEHIWHDINRTLVTNSKREFANITIYIQSKYDISVSAVSELFASVGIFQLIPKGSFGKEYFVPVIDDRMEGVATVSALSEPTYIIIRFNTPVKLREEFLHPGEQISKSLNPFETFQAKVRVPGNDSATIMHIVSDKPVAVVSGSICARIPLAIEATCDYLVEQFPPFSQWGRRFTVPPFYNRSRYSLLIVAGRNNTEVTLRTGIRESSFGLRQGNYKMINLDDVEIHVTSTKPVLVISFSTSRIIHEELDGDPAMIIVPPYEQFILGEQYFYIPDLGIDTKHYISITATCDSIMDFILDATSVNSSSLVVKGKMCFSNLPIENGNHTIKHRSNNASYMLASYGFNSRSGYGRLVSFNTRPITCRAHDELHDVILEYNCDDLEKSFCPDDVTNGNITWPQTGMFTTVKSEEICSLYYSRAGEPVRSRRCILDDDPLEVKWEEPLIGCGEPKPVKTPQDLETTIVTTENVEEVSMALESVTKEIDDITTDDVVAVSEALAKVVETGSSSPQVTESVVQTVDTVMADLSLADTEEQDGGDLETTETAMSTSAMVQLMEQQIHQSLEVVDNFAIIEESIQVQAFNLKVEEIADNVALTPAEVQTGGDAHTSAILPKNVFNLQLSTVAVSFVLYRDDSLFRTTSDKFQNKRAPELVLSISVGTVKVHRLKEPVVLNFPTPKENKSISKNTSCVFWDFQLNDGSGDWSDEGCTFKGATNQSVTCECNHLTNFAVLMDYMDEVEVMPVAYQNFLNVVTIIGCSLSILGLSTTLVVFFTFKRLRSSRPRRILVHLCIALLCLYCTFLFGIDLAVNSKWACPMVGALIHYFLLSTIFWMGVEALNIYLMLVRVFNMNVRRFVLKSALIAWGTPVVVVGMCLIFAPEQYQRETYCFLTQGSVFFFALIAPMALVLFCNMFIFFLVFRNLMTSNMAGTVHRKKTDMDMLRERLQNAITMTILMGLTWTFGFLMFGHTRFIFQFLFCLCNSFQGLLVFILFCWRQEDVRKTLRPHCVSAKRKGKEVVGAKADYDVTNSMTGQHTTGLKVSLDTRKNIVSTTSTSSTILLSPNKIKINNNQKNSESHI